MAVTLPAGLNSGFGLPGMGALGGLSALFSSGRLMKTNVMRELEAAGVAYTVRPHSRKVYTCEDVAIERGVRLSQIVKTMIVKRENGQAFLALLPGHRRLSLRRLANLLGDKKVSMASPDEVHKITGYEVGAVSPIGVRKSGLAVFVDASVLAEDFVDISGGRHDVGVELRSADLVKAVGGQVVEISEE